MRQPPEPTLFPALPVDVPFASCAQCGRPFRPPHALGRPRRYCDQCRRSVRLAQISEWRTHPRPETAVATCRQCGAPLSLAGRRCGRLPYFCSRACRAAAKRSAQSFDELKLDLFTTGEHS